MLKGSILVSNSRNNTSKQLHPGTEQDLRLLAEQNITSEMRLLNKRIEINSKIITEYEEMISALTEEINSKFELLQEYKDNLQVNIL